MGAKDNGGAAFPVNAWDGPNGNNIWPEPGMTLRDYFAAQALPALIAKVPLEITELHVTRQVQMVVGGAYDYADAMIAERYK